MKRIGIGLGVLLLLGVLARAQTKKPSSAAGGEAAPAETEKPTQDFSWPSMEDQESEQEEEHRHAEKYMNMGPLKPSGPPPPDLGDSNDALQFLTPDTQLQEQENAPTDRFDSKKSSTPVPAGSPPRPPQDEDPMKFITPDAQFEEQQKGPPEKKPSGR